MVRLVDTAVKMACEHFHVSRADLELRMPRRHHHNKTHVCNRIAILAKIYKSKSVDHPMVPCDLQYLLRRVSTSRVLQDEHASGFFHCS